MFTPGEIEAIPLGAEKLFNDLENRIMTDVIRRLKNNNNEIIRSADWQINRLYEMGIDKKNIRAEIQKTLKLTNEEIDEIYDEVIKSGYARNEKIYKACGKEFIPFDDNTELQQLIQAISDQTKEEFKNITQSLGFMIEEKNGKRIFKPIADFYQKTLDDAIMDVTSGTFDFNTVLKRTVQTMTKSGLRTVDYASGWTNRIEVATRRAVLTGFNQVVAQVNERNAEELDTDYFEVSYHGGARPTHQVWQGKVYSKKQLETVCGLGTVTGLCGANCYHSYSPFFPGISKRQYSDAELERMNKEENTPKEYNGKKYTKYEALQKQRRMETVMRAQRQKIHLLKEGGADEDDIIAARCKYRGTSAEYSRFSKAMNLKQQRDRVTVDGLGNIGVGKWKSDSDKVKIPLPKGFKDRRVLKDKINIIDLEKFKTNAEKLNVQLGSNSKDIYGGFDNYRGNNQVLQEILECVSRNQKVLTRKYGNDKIILKYRMLVDDSGKVDTETFAMTKGKTITLNKFMYDDSFYLSEEYKSSVDSGFFAKGTTYKNIIDHEFGHIFAKKDKSVIPKIKRVIEYRSKSMGVSESEYIVRFISEYADTKNELPAEINSMLNGSSSKFAKTILKEAHII